MFWLFKIGVIIVTATLVSIANYFFGPKLSDDSPLYRCTIPAAFVLPIIPFFSMLEYNFYDISDAVKALIWEVVWILAIWGFCTLLVLSSNGWKGVWTNYRSFREMTLQDDAQFEYRCLPVLCGKSHKCICVLNPLAWYDYNFSRFFNSFSYSSLKAESEDNDKEE